MTININFKQTSKYITMTKNMLCMIFLFLYVNDINYINAFVLDTFTVSPNIYEDATMPCISVVYDGKITVTQQFPEYTRKTTLEITDTENIPSFGHSLCVANGMFIKSSGPNGISYFEMEYMYNPMIMINTEVSPLLLRMRIDLPQNIILDFAMETDNGMVLNDNFMLGDFMVENKFYTLVVFSNVTTDTYVKYIKFRILPPENNIDMRITYPLNNMRTNYFQYRHVETSPYDQRGILAVDGDSSTTWRIKEYTQANITINFPQRVLNKSITINWLAPPTSANIGYFTNTNPRVFINIQNWNNSRPINKTDRKLMPKIPIDNIHLIVDGFAVLTEIKYV